MEDNPILLTPYSDREENKDVVPIVLMLIMKRRIVGRLTHLEDRFREASKRTPPVICCREED